MPPTNEIICGDSIKLLNAWPEGWVDLIFADPPFNIGYIYDGYDDRRETQEYLDFSRNWMAAVRRVLKPNGSFYLAIGDSYAADLCVIARRELGFHMRSYRNYLLTLNNLRDTAFLTTGGSLGWSDSTSGTESPANTNQDNKEGITNRTWNREIE